VGDKTPIFMRFSTVTVGREYPDEARNPRGFAVKFYTAEGNYDIVGLNFVSLPKGFQLPLLTYSAHFLLP
jgi:catalase